MTSTPASNDEVVVNATATPPVASISAAANSTVTQGTIMNATNTNTANTTPSLQGLVQAAQMGTNSTTITPDVVINVNPVQSAPAQTPAVSPQSSPTLSFDDMLQKLQAERKVENDARANCAFMHLRHNPVEAKACLSWNAFACRQLRPSQLFTRAPARARRASTPRSKPWPL